MASKKSSKSKKAAAVVDPVEEFKAKSRTQQAAFIKNGYDYLIRLSAKMAGQPKDFSYEVDKVVGNSLKKFDFNREEFDLLHEQMDAFVGMLGKKAKSLSRGGKSTLTAIRLGDVLRDFFMNPKNRKYFMIREYKKGKGKSKEEVVHEHDPFENEDDLRLMKKGLTFSQTAQNLFRAYNTNRKLPYLATHNRNIEKKSKKKGKELEEAINKSYSGFDEDTQKQLAPIIEKLGDYLKSTEPEREKARKEKSIMKKTKAPAKHPVKETETKKTEGFDPEQFQSNPTWQSILKLGRKYDPSKKEDAVLKEYSAAEPLSKDELEELRTINTEKYTNKTWQALLVQDEATMTPAALKKRKEKSEARIEKRVEKGEDEEDIEETVSDAEEEGAKEEDEIQSGGEESEED